MVYIAEKQGKMLYELRPDIFPTGYMDDVEMLIWCLRSEEEAENLKKVNR